MISINRPWMCLSIKLLELTGVGRVLNVVGKSQAGQIAQELFRPLLGQLDIGTISYGDFKDPNVIRWGNVSFADNYYQEIGNSIFTATPNGRAIDGADINIPLSGLSGFSNVPARAGFTHDDFGIEPIAPSLFGIGGPHSRIWRWYAGTTDLSIEEFQAKGGEPIYRSLADGERFAGSEIPWYVANGFTLAAPDSPWEGIGAGWFFSPQGGGAPTSIISGTPAFFNNTEVPTGIDPAVPSLFNGNFEYGNLHPSARYPGIGSKDALSSPGWFFHGGNYDQGSATIETEAAGNHVLELSSPARAEDNARIVHNRFYVSASEESVRFFARVESREFFRQTGTLSVYLIVGGQREQIGSIQLNDLSSSYVRQEFSLHNTSIGNIAGKVAQLEFELSHPGTPGPRSGVDRVRLDNIALIGQGQALLAETPIVPQGSVGGVEEAALELLINAAQSTWAQLVHGPDWGVGIQGGLLGIAAANLSVDQITATGSDSAETQRNAGFSERCLDNQVFLSNSNWPISGLATSEYYGTPVSTVVIQGEPAADKLTVNNDSSPSADSHTIEAQVNSWLSIRKEMGIFQPIASGETDLEPIIGDNGTIIDYRPIGVSNFNVSFDTTAPSGYRFITNSDFLNLEQLPLLSLKSSANATQILNTKGVKVSPIFGVTSGLSQGEHENDQNSLQHNLSFGSHTLPPDRNLVNPSGAFSGSGLSGLLGLSGLSGAGSLAHRSLGEGGSFVLNHSALSAAQLALLNSATISIADLADGYLALTTGTTITLDIDAAGYGWFIDQTPLLSEEFTPSAVSHQLSANLEGPAAGKIDLLTVLMHELGHVMGLGHVSSAVSRLLSTWVRSRQPLTPYPSPLTSLRYGLPISPIIRSRRQVNRLRRRW